MGILSSDEQDLDHSLENNQFFHYIDNINYITIKESNGDEYKGERVEKQKHGRGILTYANHEKFKSYDVFGKIIKNMVKVQCIIRMDLLI